jgi:CRP/FNR family cyclic AMP-dependent transcriptional regulator
MKTDVPQDRVIDPEWENFFAENRVAEGPEPLVRVLGRIPILSLLRVSELKLLSRIVHIRTYDPGETVIQRGAKQSGFYLVRSGSVNIVRSRGGESQVVDTLHPPALLSEFALVDDAPRSTSIVAAEPSQLIGFFKPDLLDLLVTKPGMGCAILLRLAEEMSRILNRDYQKLLDLGYPFIEAEEVSADLDPTMSEV